MLSERDKMAAALLCGLASVLGGVADGRLGREGTAGVGPRSGERFTLALAQPLERQAFHNASMWSWGAGIVHWPAQPESPGDGLFHLFGSGMTNGQCPIDGPFASCVSTREDTDMDCTTPYTRRGCRQYHHQWSSRAGSKLPLPLYADVRTFR